MVYEERLNAFLEELTELSKKYGLVISGCGCHNSPYLIDYFTGDWKFSPDEKYWYMELGDNSPALEFDDKSKEW